MSGSGDSVCFILNDLLNWELFRNKYKFKQPDFSQFKKTNEIEESFVDLENINSEGKYPT